MKTNVKEGKITQNDANHNNKKDELTLKKGKRERERKIEKKR